MRNIELQGWNFQIEYEKTKSYYDTLSNRINAQEYLPELTAFLSSLGVNVCKPVKVTKDTLLYCVYGKATSQDGYELDFYGENKYVSIAVYPQVLLGRFELFVFGYEF